MAGLPVMGTLPARRGRSQLDLLSRISLPQSFATTERLADGDVPRGRSLRRREPQGRQTDPRLREAPETPNRRRFGLPSLAIGGILSGLSVPTSGLDGAINKEVAMSRTTRRTPTFDAMEGRVLLASGMSDPAAQVHRAMAVHRPQTATGHFMLNGALVGIPFGRVGQDGIVVSSFPLSGRVQSMGKVTGSLLLTDPIIAPGKQPDLSNATLTLSNARGSVQLKTAASPSNRHVFIVTAGSGAYAAVYGSGTAIITYNQRMHEYQIALRSTIH
jgi:hypothetical protein